MKNVITDILGIKYPIIMAPMFLVTNTQMVIEALKADITAAIPALNFRSDSEFRSALREIKNHSSKPFGVNLIVNKSNYKLKNQLRTCLEMKVGFIITSLGNPENVIQQCKPLGIKVFCDVINSEQAIKLEKLGADAVIAVNSMAGGHTGVKPQQKLISELLKKISIPIISAGGISRKDKIKEAMDLGAQAVSVGTIFIASDEASISDNYKNALVEYGAKDIILTRNISGTPLTVINTPYMQKVGNKQTIFSNIANRKPIFKKYLRMIFMLTGIKSLEKAANKTTYKTIWVAGPSIEDIHEIKPVKKIVESLVP